MSRRELISLFEEMGQLMELDGANPFKAGAYLKAAVAIAEFDKDFRVYVENNRLLEIPGIGRGIAEKVVEYYRDGKISELEELRKRIPPVMIELMHIPALGAKKARVLCDSLNVCSIVELKAACKDGRVARLKGFGEKSAEKILVGIEQLSKYAGKIRLDTALKAAFPIRDALREHPDVIHAEIAGSLRRGRELIGDLDFVVSSQEPHAVMEYFTKLPLVATIVGKGETKSTVVFHNNIQADLRCVTEEQFAYALLHFTGSKDHNTRLRSLARERGMKLNEYGLFPTGSEESLPAKSEREVYAHLGLHYIVPEVREDLGEVEEAERREVSGFLRDTHFRGHLHMHTHYSDGKPTLADYASWAQSNGIEWMGISDHSQSLTIARGLTEERVLEQHREIDAVNGEYPNVRLLKGIECDILADGSLDYRDEFLANFEWIVASVHSHFRLTEMEQTHRIIRALENPYTTVLGHMTGRLLLSRDGYFVDQREIIKRAAELGVAIEINSNPRRLDFDWRLVRFATDQGCMICVTPDAHTVGGLEDIQYGVMMARKGWATREQVLNCLSAEEFLAFAKKRQGASR